MAPRLLLAALAALLTVAPASAQGADCIDGVAALPDVGAFPCRDVDLVGYLSVGAIATADSPAANGNNDIWGWTDPVTGTEYALVGTYNGTGFVDLSTPSFPRLVGKLPTPNELAPVWRDIKVYDNHAFIVADNARDHGVQVFDLTRLRGQTGDAVTFAPDAVYRGIRSAHNIVINEETGFAYVVGFRYPPGRREELGLPPSCDLPGFHVLDVRDPKNPEFVTCFSDAETEVGPRTPGYTHDAQCVIYRGPDADYQGQELCFAANEDVVTVFDVSDKSDVQIVSQAFYPSASYTHQGWLTADQRFFLTDDELDERDFSINQRTMVLDLNDLDNPELAFIYDSGRQTIDHNQYVRGRYAFQSNYEAGLRILDLDQIANGSIREVAYFDTFPPSNLISFDGQWSNYPYFESGLVIANDDLYGLFILRPSPTLGLSEDEDLPVTPAGYTLTEPRPNPSTGSARLTLRVDEAQQIQAALYDIAGRHMADLYNGAAAPGAAILLRVPEGTLPAGLYVLQVRGETFSASRRVVVTR